MRYRLDDNNDFESRAEAESVSEARQVQPLGQYLNPYPWRTNAQDFRMNPQSFIMIDRQRRMRQDSEEEKREDYGYDG